MSRTVRLNMEVSDYVAEGVRDVVASGAFGSESELVDEVLHHWLIAQKMGPVSQAELQASFERSLQEPGVDAELVFDRLEQKYRAMAEAQELKAQDAKT